jgi:integrase
VTSLVKRDVDDGGALLWVSGTKTDAAKRVVELPVMLGRLVVARRDTSLQERIFAGTRFWLRDQVRRICKLAGVPVVCPHGLRGTHASLAMAAGASSALVAKSLGHASDAVTLAHYAQPAAVAAGAQERLLKVLEGGKR